MTTKTTPVLLLTGYLGSGKTTLLNKILTNRKGIKFAVIVNDIGEVNIDADLIAKGGVVGGDDDSLVALQNGCICCTLKTDLMQQLSDLVQQNFDYIVIEASGICEPEPIAQTICSMPAIAPNLTRHGVPVLDCIVTVVDALRLKSEFEAGDALTSKELGEEDIESLVIQQIEFCNVILLNKISEVSAEDAAHIKSIIRALQPKADIVECDFCEIDFDKILNTGLFNFEKTVTAATWIQEIEKPLDDDHDNDRKHHHNEHEHEHHHDHENEHEHEHEHHHDHDGEHHDHEAHDHHHHHHHHHDGEGEAEEYGIGTFVYFRRRPFDINKFDWFVAKHWPKSVIRAKGICYFSDNTDMSYLFEQAGIQKKLTEAGQWYATAPEEEIERMLATEPGLRRDWDNEYGDRMQKLVFIGQHLDREAITAALDACLD